MAIFGVGLALLGSSLHHPAQIPSFGRGMYGGLDLITRASSPPKAPCSWVAVGCHAGPSDRGDGDRYTAIPGVSAIYVAGVRGRVPKALTVAQGAHSLTVEHLGRIPVDSRLFAPPSSAVRQRGVFGALLGH